MRCAGALSLSKDTILRLDMLSAHVEMRALQQAARLEL